MSRPQKSHLRCLAVSPAVQPLASSFGPGPALPGHRQHLQSRPPGMGGKPGDARTRRGVSSEGQMRMLGKEQNQCQHREGGQTRQSPEGAGSGQAGGHKASRRGALGGPTPSLLSRTELAPRGSEAPSSSRQEAGRLAASIRLGVPGTLFIPHKISWWHWSPLAALAGDTSPCMCFWCL